MIERAYALPPQLFLRASYRDTRRYMWLNGAYIVSDPFSGQVQFYTFQELSQGLRYAKGLIPLNEKRLYLLPEDTELIREATPEEEGYIEAKMSRQKQLLAKNVPRDLVREWANRKPKAEPRLRDVDIVREFTPKQLLTAMGGARRDLNSIRFTTNEVGQYMNIWRTS